jgi:hypothetical protein
LAVPFCRIGPSRYADRIGRGDPVETPAFRQEGRPNQQTGTFANAGIRAAGTFVYITMCDM